MSISALRTLVLLSMAMQSSERIPKKLMPASRRSSWLLREYLIEQEIDEHARDGHVHPERPGPTRNPPVLIEPFAQPAHECGQNHRNDHNSQKSMRQQNQQVDGAKPCRLKEARRATVQDI